MTSPPTKQEARAWAKSQRGLVQPSVSRQIAASLLTLPQLRDGVVYAYWPDLSRGELDLSPTWEALADRGTKIALPHVDGRRSLAFYLWSPGDVLVADGHYGICEPAPSSSLAPPPDTVILPGIAADPSGIRLGYGGGFYDTLLTRHPDALRIFPIASACVAPELPHEPHDVRVDLIVTERFCLWTRAGDRATVQPEPRPAVPIETPYRPAPIA